MALVTGEVYLPLPLSHKGIETPRNLPPFLR